MNEGRRLYKLTLVSGLILAAPLVVGTAWYAWSAYATVDRYRRALEPTRPIDAEMFQLVLHDELARDLRSLGLSERPAHGQLPTFSLSLKRSSIDGLQAMLGKKGPKTYVPVLVEKDGKVRQGETRYRGDQPWHALAAQKSLKIELEKGELLDGVRVFNLINDPTPFGLEDEIILDVAREMGLLAPEYHPVRVRINNADMGVYRFESQPDETMLRQARRMPGDMYSGEAEAKEMFSGLGPLFTSTVAWKRVASRNADEETDDVLARFVDQVAHASYAGFATYAERELDLSRYAEFEALDVVFGGSEHDYLSNHRIYVDPYKGRIEPVAWSFRGFQHEETFDAIDHPLLMRLDLVPGWIARRDRAVYQLLTGRASVPSIRARADAAVALLADELASDPYWDAYKLLPRASRFYRFLPRPMTLDRWALSAQVELAGFAVRSRWLLDALEAPGLGVARGEVSDGTWRVGITIDGHAAYAVSELRTSADCAGEAQIHADTNLDGSPDRLLGRAALGESAELSASIFARAKLVDRPDPAPKRGQLKVVLEPTRFDFFVTATGCVPREAALVLESLVTGASTRVDVSPRDAVLAPIAAHVNIDAVPRFVAQEISPHPWAFAPPPEPRTIQLGPGLVAFDAAREYPPTDAVEIAAGTTLALGPEVSLVFEGRVTALGTAARPITIRRLDPAKAFGGIALQGPSTQGSRLTRVIVQGGSRARSSRVDYPGLVNVHDTADIELEEWKIEGSTDNEDVIHANAVERLALHEITVIGAPIDGVDLEFVTADLRGGRISDAGDDCLDLMGSTVRVHDSLFLRCTNNGISAGEETDLTAHGIVVSSAKTGVLAKNASQARLIRSLIYRTRTALKARKEEVRYGGPSRVGTSEVYVLEAQTVQDSDKGSAIEVDEIHLEPPSSGELARLLEQVIGAQSWGELDARLETGFPSRDESERTFPRPGP